MPTKDHPVKIARTASQSLFSDRWVLGHVKNGVAIIRPLYMRNIASGAMAVSMVEQAKARAFRRDLEAQTLTGVTVEDMTDVVADVFEQNKGLDHSFALKEM